MMNEKFFLGGYGSLSYADKVNDGMPFAGRRRYYMTAPCGRRPVGATMNELSQDILERATAGEMTAFKEIYDAYAGFVYSVALRVVRDSASAEEVTQDVFMKVYEKLHEFENRSSLKTWIYRIAVNTAINCGRRLSKERNRRTDYDSVILTQSVPPDERGRLEQSEREAAVQSLLSALSPEQRACMILREIENLSYEEMAEVLKININTVRSRLKRAREALVAYARKSGVSYEL
ncbi:MAG: sigma-70 family RNA polymerase sigma factor [Candidatus Omnitrophica bacterium]|nr:sigma-70 family RNA polymerase sigma factor [Candidatus Omnitrophota bacterium]MDD5671038.1 sigma-70 family RNA polymerase sigma factor [Candidatus Omnitrophota bacterium]